MEKTDVVRAICSKGGMILYEDLETMAPLQEIKSVIAQNPDTFANVCLGGRMFVRARCSLSLCKTPDCAGCYSLHMCEDYMLGNCEDPRCPYSHDLYSPYNLWVLNQHDLIGLKEHEIAILLFQDEPPPHPPPEGPQTWGEHPQTWVDPPTSSQPLATPQPAPRRVRPPTGADTALPVHTHVTTNLDATLPLGRCGKAHSRVPYLWQRRDGKAWSALPNNEAVERDYCNPAKTKHAGTPPVDFDLMQSSGSAEVRRLSVTSPTFHTASELVTRWAWYWELTEDQWIEYQPPEDKPSKLAITSEKLEQKYQKGVQSLKFARGESVYILDFVDFLQTNMATDMKRLVRRRPVFVSQADVQNVSEKYSRRIQPNFLSSIPEHWDRSLLPGTGYERIKLVPSSQEHRNVLHKFNLTLGRCAVTSVEKVQNLKLWRFFMLQKNQMKNEAGRDVSIKQLFHGVESDYVDTICHVNIDWRVSGLQDTRFGKGSYFGRDASYANKYADKQEVRFMFLCQVLVGVYTVGHSTYNTPPFKDDKKTVSFDSCVDDVTQPSTYVIFERNQIYPEYLIQYTCEPEALPTPQLQPQPTPQSPPQPPPAQVQPLYEPLSLRQPRPFVPPPPPPPPPPAPKPRCDCDCDLDCCDWDYCDCGGLCFRL
ncbi:hypothetical protein ACEWY4_002244 [Coilia grayii]|uniref:Poly [ADP-ribose] polymerase n=1 Tax=Coilia grayii TaxID=363190 RepID=A0ABD1KV80_9TELE